MVTSKTDSNQSHEKTQLKFSMLVVDRMAEELISLNDEYKNIIKLVSEYKIKHGQIIKIYSVHSTDFGNSNIPEKIQLYPKKG